MIDRGTIVARRRAALRADIEALCRNLTPHDAPNKRAARALATPLVDKHAALLQADVGGRLRDVLREVGKYGPWQTMVGDAYEALNVPRTFYPYHDSSGAPRSLTTRRPRLYEMQRDELRAFGQHAVAHPVDLARFMQGSDPDPIPVSACVTLGEYAVARAAALRYRGGVSPRDYARHMVEASRHYRRLPAWAKDCAESNEKEAP